MNFSKNDKLAIFINGKNLSFIKYDSKSLETEFGYYTTLEKWSYEELESMSNLSNWNKKLEISEKNGILFAKIGTSEDSITTEGLETFEIRERFEKNPQESGFIVEVIKSTE